MIRLMLDCGMGERQTVGDQVNQIMERSLLFVQIALSI
jgi:hypothetical protein